MGARVEDRTPLVTPKPLQPFPLWRVQAGEGEPVQAAVGKHPTAPSWQENTKHLVSLGREWES